MAAGADYSSSAGDIATQLVLTGCLIHASIIAQDVASSDQVAEERYPILLVGVAFSFVGEPRRFV